MILKLFATLKGKISSMLVDWEAYLFSSYRLLRLMTGLGLKYWNGFTKFELEIN